MDYLSLCIIVKDEQEYLPEWLDYHLLLGVERFYIYDNGSHVSLRETLKEYVSRGFVVITDIAGEKKQLAAYDHCLQVYGDQTFWLGFIDTDEFLVPKKSRNLSEFLKEYEPYAGLAVNWLVFGSGGHIQKPAGGQMANFTMRTPDRWIENRVVKSIVQPAKTILPHSPHHFIYREGQFCVNENGLRVEDMRFPNSVERIQLNHYFCRSREEFESKLVRGRGDGGQAYDFERFNRYDRAATIEDSCIINLVSQLVDHFTVGADPKEWVVDALSRTLKRIEIPRVTQIQSQTTAIERYDIKEFIREHDYLLYGKNVDPQYRESQLTRLLAAYPTAIPFYMSLAEHYIDLGRLESAWELLAKAWKLAPNSLSVLMSMGKYFLASQDFDHAEKTYRLAQALDPDGFDLCCQLGRVLMLKGKMQEGAELIANAIEKIPEAANEEGMADLIRKIGIFFYQNRDIKRAQALLKIVMKFNPRDYETFIALGKISFDQKQFQNARKYLKQAQQIDPDGEEAKLGLKLLSHKS